MVRTVPSFQSLGGSLGAWDSCWPLGEPLGSSWGNPDNAQALGNSQALGNYAQALNDPQAVLLLCRHCASFCRIAYLCRTVPLALHEKALKDFDARVRATFERITGLSPDDATWTRAQWGVDVGGLGLRSARGHADAAYFASRAATANLVTAVDPGAGDVAGHGKHAKMH